MSRDARIAAQRLANMTCHFEILLLGPGGGAEAKFRSGVVNATESWQLDCVAVVAMGYASPRQCTS